MRDLDTHFTNYRNNEPDRKEVTISKLSSCVLTFNCISQLNGSQLAKMKKSIPDMSLP